MMFLSKPFVVMMVLSVFLGVACQKISIDGKWNIKRVNSEELGKEWKTDISPNDYILFDEARGEFEVRTLQNGIRKGRYMLNTKTEPNLISLQGEGSENWLHGIFKVEGTVMTMKLPNNPKVHTPVNFEPESKYEVSELFRATAQ